MAYQDGYRARGSNPRAHAVSGAQGTAQRALCGMEVVVAFSRWGTDGLDDPHLCRRCVTAFRREQAGPVR